MARSRFGVGDARTRFGRFVAPGLFTLVVLAVAIAAPASPGALDPAFGNGGIITGRAVLPNGIITDPTGGRDPQLDFGTAIDDLVLQPDGKIVTAAGTGVRRFTADGALDVAFGIDGETIPRFDRSCGEIGVALTATGKILTSGVCGNDFALIRYLSNGTPDLLFGSRGVVKVNLGGNDIARSLAVQPDNKIVLVGSSVTTGIPARSRAVLVRFKKDGTLDATFGNGGKVVLDLGSPATFNDVAVQADGAIVAVGSRSDVTTGTNVVIVRVRSNGYLDSTFGGTGVVTTDLGGSVGRGLVAQPNGKLVVVGRATGDLILLRYGSTGALDPAFGTGGVARTQSAYIGTAVARQADGAYVAVGSEGDSYSFAVARFLSTGVLDSGFGAGGVVTTNVGADSALAESVAIQPDGKIVVGGTRVDALSERDATSSYAIARYLAS